MTRCGRSKSVAMCFQIVVIMILAGCVSPRFTTMDKLMSEWIGRNEAELMMKFGAPDTQITLQDGARVYTWKKLQSDENMKGTVEYSEGRMSYSVSKEGIVTAYSYENMPRICLTWKEKTKTQ